MSDLSIPPIFKDLLDQTSKQLSLTPEIMDSYFEYLNDDESFIPELVAIVGPVSFITLIKSLGGQTIQIPRAEEILKIIRKVGHGSK